MIQLPTETDPIRVHRDYLKKMGVTYSFTAKDKYLERMKLYDDVIHFTWRDDQRNIIDSFLKQENKYTVLNAVFGSGKTTLLMGIHIYSLLLSLYQASEALFLSFNVCIRNELTQKLKTFGSNKTDVRTFDSVVYEICKLYEYPYLDLPNYEGKRKFVYKICKEIIAGERELKSLSVNPKFIFIDECQDLEHQTFILFQTFFEDAHIIFVGDVFQSIQKEPRESLLWHLLNCPNEQNLISRYYMKETPRVPEPILNSVKRSLIDYYPEYEQEINGWRSSSQHNNNDTKVEWHRFYNYSDIFKEMDTFLATHPPEKSMILTFSSAITVKGAMGDLARIRRYLFGKGFDMNKNHKKMDHDKLFLSTVNSSKGLERDYIFIVSTFPLERAFMNFSNDLVINLITVGMTRAKKKVLFYVPAYKDKFSSTLEHYFDCPKPNKEKIRDGKNVKELVFGDFIHLEHCVTEILKQNMIKYDTRIKLRDHIKQFESSKVFDTKVPAPKIDTEEERGFVGILIENLITSSWVMRWPSIDDIEMLRNHPMYTHCFKKIEQRLKTYLDYTKKHKCNDANQFQGIYYYSQIHVAMYNKLFVDLSPKTVEYLKTYWATLREKAIAIRPTEGKIAVQSNMRMPWATGISDVMITVEKEKGGDDEDALGKKDEVTIWELKASVDVDWKENALIQAALYGLMSGKSWCRLVLLNPFRNEKCSYYFNMKKVMHLRELLIDDLLIWNLNCYLSKNVKTRGNSLSVTNQLFLSMTDHQYTLTQFMSPTKMDLVYNGFVYNKGDKQRKEMNKLEKLCADEDEKQTKEGVVQKIKELLNTPQYRDAKVYVLGDKNSIDFKEEEERFLDVYEMAGKTFEEMVDGLGYVKNEELKYEADFSDSLVRMAVASCYLSKEYKLV
jgi:hypothetical protein